jgi:hypothetical protein
VQADWASWYGQWVSGFLGLAFGCVWHVNAEALRS